MPSGLFAEFERLAPQATGGRFELLEDDAADLPVADAQPVMFQIPGEAALRMIGQPTPAFELLDAEPEPCLPEAAKGRDDQQRGRVRVSLPNAAGDTPDERERAQRIEGYRREAEAGAVGAGYGALYGAGKGDGVADRANRAVTGAGLGGVLGAGASAALTGVGMAGSLVADRARRIGRCPATRCAATRRRPGSSPRWGLPARSGTACSRAMPTSRRSASAR